MRFAAVLVGSAKLAVRYALRVIPSAVRAVRRWLDKIRARLETAALREKLAYRIDHGLIERYASAATAPPAATFCISDPLPEDPGLTPAAYDDLERVRTATFAPPLLAAFRPITFERSGFPTRIRDVREIVRYADWNWEPQAARLFLRGAIYPEHCFTNAFTADEWSLVEGLGQSVARMTEKRTGRAVRPVTNLMNAVSPLRIIARLAQITVDRPMTIFEVGPGVAYLGPMLAKSGHRYRCFDATQAYYLWQHHMLRWAVGDEFEEMAGKASDAPIPEKQIVNLPWWRYVEFLFDEVIQSVDIVYSNANLCEMTADARRCVLQVSQRMLAASPVGMFFYIGPGQQAQCTVDELKSEMRSNGFHRVAETPFAAWTTRPEAAAAVQALFAEGIPFFNPSGRPELYPADLVMRIPRNEAPVDIPYARWLSGWEPSYRD